MNILQKIIEYKKKEIKKLPKIENQGLKTRNFFKAITENENKISLIAEIKKFSPSTSQIIKQKDFSIKTWAQDFEKAQVSAISILTDKKFFGGDFSFLTLAKKATQKVPLLAKDFFISSEQVELAKNAGADCILLIAKILKVEQIKTLYKLAQSKKIDCLLEIADNEDLQKALKTDCRLIGINNRSLQNFHINIANTFCLAKKIPLDRKIISMSGFQSNEIKIIQNIAQGVLIGTAISGSKNPFKKIKEVLSNKPLIKICGLRTSEVAQFCENKKINFCGLNFVPHSKRKVSLKEALKLRKDFSKTKVVGVFQDQSVEFINHYAQELDLNFVQLHGTENYNFCCQIKKPIIKAVAVNCYLDLLRAEKLKDVCDLFLFDNKVGGSGKNFDHQLLIDFLNHKDFKNPFFIAGGINQQNAAKLCNIFAYFPNFLGIDLASGVESKGEIKVKKIATIADIFAKNKDEK